MMNQMISFFKFSLPVTFIFSVLSAQVSQQIRVEAGWNLLSLPVAVTDSLRRSIFPTAVSRAFIYTGGYLARDTLECGHGFWLKFNSADSCVLKGSEVFEDTVSVYAGWNLIGSVRVPIAVNSIQTVPPGIMNSAFFGYVPGLGYVKADTLRPGLGYWTRVMQNGRMIRSIRGIQLSYSPADSIEAGDLAVWYSGQNCPSDSLIGSILYSLKFLRYCFDTSMNYGQSFPVLRENRFFAPWAVSQLVMGVDDTTAVKINRGEYDAWNRFEPYLRPAGYDSLYHQDAFVLRFNGFLHPRRLAELYRNLPGIRYAEPRGYMFVEWSTFPIFPRFDGQNWSYLFISHFDWRGPKWFFKYVKGIPTFVGVRNPGDPEPPWWSEAFLNDTSFVHWDGPPH